jgi:hypothetical protein
VTSCGSVLHPVFVAIKDYGPSASARAVFLVAMFVLLRDGVWFAGP